MGRVKSEMFEDDLGPDDELVPRQILLTGGQVKNMRENAGVSQAKLAAFLGYYTKGEPNRSMVCQIEQGLVKIRPPLDTAIREFFRRIKANA